MNANAPVATITSRTDAWKNWALSADRTPLFSVELPSVDGAEPELVTYSMPAKPNPGLALRILSKARKEGELATAWVIEEAIGEAGYEALSDELINYDGDSVALLRGIVEKIQKVAMGGLDNPKA